MTVIVAYTDGKDTWIGSDRLSAMGSTRVMRPGKWTVSSGWAMAIAGATRYAMAIEKAAPELFSHIDDKLELSQSLAAIFRSYGMTPKRDDDEGVELWEVGGMLACRGQIWDMDNSLTFIAQPAERLFGGGSGWKFAEGAAWALKERVVPPASPEYLVRKAIECACALDPANCEGLWQGKL